MTDRRFAEVHGSPGERPRVVGLMRALWLLMGAFILVGYLLRAAFPHPELPGPLVGLLLLGFAALLGVAVRRMRLQFEVFLKGARGEEAVGRALAFLPAAYRVFHGLAPADGRGASPGRDFDHVVVGPTGVYLIETKSWQGRMTVAEEQLLYDGRRADRQPVAQAREAAQLLAGMLAPVAGRRLEVQPVICSALNTVAGGRLAAVGVIVCNVRDIVAVLCEPGEERLSGEDIAALAGALETADGLN